MRCNTKSSQKIAVGDPVTIVRGIPVQHVTHELVHEEPCNTPSNFTNSSNTATVTVCHTENVVNRM